MQRAAFFRQPIPGTSFSTEIPSPSPSPTPWPCNGDAWTRSNGHFKANTSHLARVLCGLQEGAHGPGHRHGEGRKHLPAIGSWSVHVHAPMHASTLTTDFRSALNLIWKADIQPLTIPWSDGNPGQTSIHACLLEMPKRREENQNRGQACSSEQRQGEVACLISSPRSCTVLRGHSEPGRHCTSCKALLPGASLEPSLPSLPTRAVHSLQKAILPGKEPVIGWVIENLSAAPHSFICKLHLDR